MKTEKSGENQNLVDVALTNYGSKWIEGIISMLKTNPELNLYNSISTAQEIVIDEVDENDFVLKSFRAFKYRVSTKTNTLYQLVPEGDYQLTPEGQRIEFI